MTCPDMRVRDTEEGIMCNCQNKIHVWSCVVRNIFTVFISGKG